MAEAEGKADAPLSYTRTQAADLAARLAASTDRAFTVRISVRLADRAMTQSVKVARAAPAGRDTPDTEGAG